MRKFPPWITAYVADWKQRLLLCEWEISTVLSPHPNGDASGDTKAVVNISLHTRKALIEFLDTVPDDLTEVDSLAADEWRKTIIHELLHIRFAPLEAVVRDDIAGQLSAAAREVAYSAFNREHESFIDIMAGVLLRQEERNGTSKTEGR